MGKIYDYKKVKKDIVKSQQQLGQNFQSDMKAEIMSIYDEYNKFPLQM